MAALSAFLDRGPARPATASAYGTVSATRIYILPTRQGLIFGALLAVMFVGSINYSNNLGYFLTFLLASMGVTSMVHTHRNMVGLKVRAGGAEPVFAPAPAIFNLLVKPTGSTRRLAVQLEALGYATAPRTVLADKDTEFQIESPKTKRGYLRLGKVAISSCYPFGLVRAWAWFELDLRCLVYPAPLGDRQLPGEQGVSHSGRRQTLGERDNYAGLRDYRPGDSLRSIAWKASARSQALHTKLFDADGKRGLVLRWRDTRGLDDEARLSQLCLWVLSSNKLGLEYELVLPRTRLGPARGDAHRRHCLEALARHGQ